MGRVTVPLASVVSPMLNFNSSPPLASMIKGQPSYSIWTINILMFQPIKLKCFFFLINFTMKRGSPLVCRINVSSLLLLPWSFNYAGLSPSNSPHSPPLSHPLAHFSFSLWSLLPLEFLLSRFNVCVYLINSEALLITATGEVRGLNGNLLLWSAANSATRTGRNLEPSCRNNSFTSQLLLHLCVLLTAVKLV